MSTFDTQYLITVQFHEGEQPTTRSTEAGRNIDMLRSWLT